MLMTSKFEFTDQMKHSMALDTANGLRYLHSKNYTVGVLNSITCYVDNSWCVQIADWHVMPMLNSEEPSVVDTLLDRPQEISEESLIALLYVDVDLAVKRDITCDLYPYGMLLLEIFTRQLPYHADIGIEYSACYKYNNDFVQF